MREIKFRAWDKNKNKMVYPTKKYTNGGLLEWFEDEDLMQYTGLKDKNGKEIYEGDVVKTGGDFGEVLYDDQHSGFIILFQPHSAKKKSGCATLASTWPSPLKEIVGNIYENPDLISQGENNA